MSYDVDDKYGKFRVGGNALLEHTSNVLSYSGTSTDFLPGGDAYSVLF